MRNVFILARSKARGNSSHALELALRERGIDAYRCTARRVPARDIRQATVIIDYGVGTVPVWQGRVRPGTRWLNTPDTVRTSANKIRTQRALERAGVPCVESTTVREEAERWLEQGETVVSRTVLEGCRGAGIVLSPPDPLPEARLYTKLFSGRVREYRAYIVGGRTIDVTQKRRWSRERTDAAGIDRDDPYTKLIRTNGNGWVFARNSIDASDEVLEAVRALGTQCAEAINLGVGAVDIVVRTNRLGQMLGIAVVEPNTSVSLVGDRTTRSIMANAIVEEIRHAHR